MTQLPVLVGAYATMPEARADQEKLYARIAERNLGTALEIPDFSVRGVSDEDLVWLADQLRGRFANSVITTIPTTMGMQGKLPGFGLASSSPDGRAAALSFIQEVRAAAEKLNELTGEQTISALHVHSAPSVTADKEAFKQSLTELLDEEGLGKGWNTRLIIEHCDAYNNDFPGEKRFLSLADEIEVASELGLGITINWGRSVVESHDASTPLAQIQKLVEADLLEGLMFSGAGEGQTQYGPNWGDAHLPLASDEEASWMTANIVKECWATAQPVARYVGVKVQTPKDRSVDERLDFVEHISDLLQ